jgi:hypothetical protein
LTFALDQTVNLPDVCPSCRERWIDTFQAGGQTAVRVTDEFIEALKQIRRAQAELKPATIMRFEFDVPPWMVGPG